MHASGRAQPQNTLLGTHAEGLPRLLRPDVNVSIKENHNLSPRGPTADCWIRDAHEEGIEPHPGPRPHQWQGFTRARHGVSPDKMYDLLEDENRDVA